MRLGGAKRAAVVASAAVLMLSSLSLFPEASGAASTASKSSPAAGAATKGSLAPKPDTGSVSSECTEGSGKVTCSYGYSGLAESFTVPDGVDEISVDAIAAGGGGGNGGGGGEVDGDLSVSGGDTITVEVGEGGGNAGAQTAYGWPNGGTGGNGADNPGCGGGGASIVELGTPLGGTSTVAEAGGGGGCGGYSSTYGPATGGQGGTGSGDSDGNGGDKPGCSSYGGSSGANGGGGGGSDGCGGNGGYGQSGGTGGKGGQSGGIGGAGGGGGGGGGWVGGGGGGGGGTDSSGGGGGGGSNYTGGLSNTSTYSGITAPHADGSVTLSWGLATTSMSAAVERSPVQVGQDIPLSATLGSSDGVAPTGSVTFISSTGLIGGLNCTASVGSSGTASCAPQATSITSYVFDVGYGGDFATGAASTTTGSVTVDKDQTTTSVQAPSEVSGSLYFNARVDPASTSSCGSGTTSLCAYQPLVGSVTFTATPTSGSPTTCQQTLSSGYSAGETATVSCLWDDPVPGMTYSVTASYSGDSFNAASSSSTPVSYEVSQAPTSTSLTVSPSSGTETYGDTVELQASVSGIPAGDSDPGDLSYVYASGPHAGTNVPCVGIANPVPVSSAGVAHACEFAPMPRYDTTPGVNDIYAWYLGDAQTSDSTSTAQPIDVTAADSSTSLSVEAEGSNEYVGVPISATAVVSDASSTGTSETPAGEVTFSLNGQPVTSGGDVVCSDMAVGALSGSPGGIGATCSDLPTPSDTSTDVIEATYCPSDVTSGDCLNWVESSDSVDYAPSPDPTEVTLDPAGTTTLNGGVDIDVQATVSVVAGPESAAGTLDFEDNGQAITDVGGNSCSALALDSGGADCDFVPTPGEDNSILVSYQPSSGSYTASSTSSPLVISVSGLPTDTAMALSDTAGAISSGSTVPYGDTVTATATVTSSGSPVASGTVAFSIDGSPISSGGTTVCASEPVTDGVASCTLPALDASGSSYDVGSSFTFAEGTYASSTGSASFSVEAASTATTLQISPHPGDPTEVDVVATVSDTSIGSTAPLGTVEFSAGGSTISSCSSVTLSPGAGSSTATCTIDAPSGPTAYSADFLPASGDFSSSATAGPTVFNPGAPCGAAYQTLWSSVEGGTGTLGFSVGSFGTSTDSLSFSAGSVVGNCSQLSEIDLSGGSVSLLGSSLTSSSNITGYLQDSGSGEAELCLTGGSLSLPSAWGIAPISLGSGNSVCFYLSSTSSSGGTIGSFASGQLVISGIALPFGSPGMGSDYELSLSFVGGSTPGLDASFAPETTPAGSVYATAEINLTVSSGTVSASGTVTIDNLPFASGSLTAQVSVTAGRSGALAGSVTFPTIAPTGSPYAPVPGAEVENIVVSLSSTSGLSLTATGLFGASGNPVTVSLSGSYSSGTFTLTLAATTVSWTPFASLSLSPTFSGTVTVTTGGAVTFDVEAGSPPSAGSGGSAVLAWNPVTGVAVTVDCVALAYGITPACSASGTTTPSDPTLYLEGLVTLGGTSTGFNAGVDGTIDLKTGQFSFDLDPSVASPVLDLSSGFTLTINSFSVGGSVGGSIDVTGSATADVTAPALGTFTVTISDTDGALLITGDVSLTPLGVPLEAFVAYSSAAVSNYATGDSSIGSVDLVAGFNAFAVYDIPSGVQQMLTKAGIALPNGDAIVLSANWTPGSLPSFTATLTPPSGFPFLELPNGGSVTSIELSFISGTLTLTLDGTIPVPDAPAASIAVVLSVSTDGSFSGSATVENLTIFGTVVSLEGSISYSAGKVTAEISTCNDVGGSCTPGPIAGTLTPFSSLPQLKLTNVEIDLGTSGLTVSGTMTLDGIGSLAVSGSLTSTSKWSLSVSASAAASWSPVPDVTISPEFSGTVSDSSGAVSFLLTATGSSGSPLLTASPPGVTLKVETVELGNGPAPAGCTLSAAGDLWLYLEGSVSLSVGSSNTSVSANGCFDLTSKALSLSVSTGGTLFTALNGDLALSAPTISFTESSGKYQVTVSVTLEVTMPTGGQFDQTATLTYASGGAFVVGTSANLSEWLGGVAGTAYIYYASADVASFDTGDPTIGSVALKAGINFALTLSLPSSVLDAMKTVGLPGSGSLVATGFADFSTKTYGFSVAIDLGSGITLFTAGSGSQASSLVFNKGSLALTLSPAGIQVTVNLVATLDVAPAQSGGADTALQLTGTLSFTEESITVGLSFGDCSSTTGGWENAFGISGLYVQCAGVQGGIGFDTGFPFPNIGFYGQIDGLPSSIASAVGYQEGAPISFAFNLDPLLLSLSIGTSGSTTPALEPLSAFGEGSALEIDYASLYFCPEGATIDNQIYAAGVGLDFDAQIVGVTVDVDAKIGIAPPSFSFTGTVSPFSWGGLSITGIKLVIEASTSSFDFEFDGGATISGSTNIGKDLMIGGSISANIELSLSTSGVSAYIWGSVSAYVDVWVATETCGVLDYCDYQWEGTSFSLTIGKTGFSVNSGGINLSFDGYSVTFDWNGSVSVNAFYVGTCKTSGHGSSVSQRAQLTSFLAHPQTPVSQARPTSSSSQVVGVGRLTSDSSAKASARHLGKSYTVSNPEVTKVTASAKVKPVALIGMWKKLKPLRQAGGYSTVANLPGGDVLVAGGFGKALRPLSGAEVYDPARNSWAAVGALSEARGDAASVVLPNGKVLVVGGWGAGLKALSTAELFDPTTGRWSSAGSMNVGRAGAVAELISKGRVLVAGGTSGNGSAEALSSAEIYDPATNSWSSTGSMSVARLSPAAAALPDGQVLVAGGSNSAGRLASAERYDPSTGLWTSAGSMSIPRLVASATVLGDGTVLVIGNGGWADRYHPASNSWSQTGGLKAPTVASNVVTLYNGDAMVLGGVAGKAVATVQLYDPRTGLWTDGRSLPTASSAADVSVLSNGAVLVAGGMGGKGKSPLATTEIFGLTPKVVTVAARGTAPVVPQGGGGEGLPWWLYLLIAVGAVSLGVIGFWRWRLVG